MITDQFTAEPADIAIDLRALRKEFGTKTAVNDISLQVETGIIFSLLGVNGAGKTTTIRMLNGLARPTAGEAYVLGKSIKDQIEQVKDLSDISPQETSVAPNLTVYENLLFMAQIYGMKGKAAVHKAEEIMNRFSLTELRKSRAKTLSGGWQRRLSIAMALVSEPKILFLDEPTLGLDVLARSELWDILRELKREMTIILTTHYMEEAEALSDRVAVMAEGELLALGTVEELKCMTGQETLEKAFIKLVRTGGSIRKKEGEQSL